MDLIAWLCMILLSTLFAFLAGLGTLHLFGMQADFSMASAVHKTFVIAVYAAYFLASLSFTLYLVRRSSLRWNDVAIEVRQRGIRIERGGRQVLLPFDQVAQVSRQPETDWTRLATSLLANRGRAPRDSLVIETKRRRSIEIPGCDDLFTSSSLADVIMEIKSRIESPP